MKIKELKKIILETLDELEDKTIDVDNMLKLANELEKQNSGSLIPDIIRSAIENANDLKKAGRPQAAQKWLELGYETAVDFISKKDEKTIDK